MFGIIRFLRKYGYVNYRGEWALKPRYDNIASLDGTLLEVCLKKKVGLYESDRGRFLFKVRFDGIARLTVNYTTYFIVRSGNRHGLFQQGKGWLLGLEYDAIAHLAGRLFSTANNGSHSLINVESGEWLFKGALNPITLENGTGGFYCILIDNTKGIWSNGWIVPPSIEGAGIESMITPDFAVLTVGRRKGLWDRCKSRFAIEPSFDALSKITFDLFIIVNGGNKGLYSLQRGELILDISYRKLEALDIIDNLVCIGADNEFGLWDEFNYSWVIGIGRKEITMSEAGREHVLIGIEGEKGLYNINICDWNLEPVYESIEPLSEDFYRISKNGKSGLFSIHPEAMVLDPRYNTVEIDALDDRFTRITADGSSGLWDGFYGKQLLEPKYGSVSIHSLGENFFRIIADCNQGVWNDAEAMFVVGLKNGKADVSNIGCNLFLIKAGETRGLWDNRKKEFIVGLDFKDISVREFDGDLLAVRADGKEGLFDKYARRWLLEIKYDEICDFGDNAYLVRHASASGLWNIENEEWVLDPEYGNIERRADGFILVTKNGRQGLWDPETEKWLLAPQDY